MAVLGWAAGNTSQAFGRCCSNGERLLVTAASGVVSFCVKTQSDLARKAVPPNVNVDQIETVLRMVNNARWAMFVALIVAIDLICNKERAATTPGVLQIILSLWLSTTARCWITHRPTKAYHSASAAIETENERICGPPRLFLA